MSRRSATIRDFRGDDLPSVLAIQVRCLLAAQWQPEQYVNLVAAANSIVLVADLAQEDGHLSGKGLDRTVQDQTKTPLAGFVAFRGIGDEAELENLAVLPEFQRQGIARRLVVAAHERLHRDGVKRVFLEARPSNLPALSLYSSIGYRLTRVRRGYYRDPDEDARVLRIEL